MWYYRFDLQCHKDLLEEELQNLKWAEYRGASFSELRERRKSIAWRKAEIQRLQALIAEKKALEVGA
jgi:hypothetical protein